MSHGDKPDQLFPTAMENIETIARLEQQFLDDRTWSDRVGDIIGSFVGTTAFVLIHVTWFAVWFSINLRLIPGVPAFDPYPFTLLTAAVSCEGVMLTTFVLMKQNRMSQRAEQRNQLNLQVDMLSEREITKILQMLTAVCERMGLDHGSEPEVQQFSKHTSMDVLAQELQKKMPE